MDVLTSNNLEPPRMSALLWLLLVLGTFTIRFTLRGETSRAKILNNGELLTLSLDKASGSGFQTKNECMFGRSICCSSFVLGNSTGTVTAYYLCSKGSDWDEIDFKFLGNQSGDPCIFHSNVFSQRKGNRASSFVSGSIRPPTFILTPSSRWILCRVSHPRHLPGKPYVNVCHLTLSHLKQLDRRDCHPPLECPGKVTRRPATSTDEMVFVKAYFSSLLVHVSRILLPRKAYNMQKFPGNDSLWMPFSGF
ncbi:hypothetical protein CRG98_019727 [Punica granatum]|uniref:GH16 domain-containing protein n=1 Tax=Punica granatum TaxID=22663 RepID=A0A2I0JU76_PUNGR|nr:hypothetical protein CRG98_019727 [Punica granatum]